MTAGRDAKGVTTMSRIMASVNGPKSGKRRSLMTATQSVRSSSTGRKESYRIRSAQAQRRCVPRIAPAILRSYFCCSPRYETPSSVQRKRWSWQGDCNESRDKTDAHEDAHDILWTRDSRKMDGKPYSRSQTVDRYKVVGWVLSYPVPKYFRILPP